MSEELQNTAVSDQKLSSANSGTTSEPPSLDKPLEAAIAHRARILRRIGFAFFGGIIVVVGGFLIYTTFHDIGQNTVYDPFTGENVMGK